MLTKEYLTINILLSTIIFSNIPPLTPATLINVSIFHLKETPNTPGEFHMFFIKGSVSLNDRSLQYLFITDLTFTHAKLNTNMKNINSKTLLDLNTILKAITTNKETMVSVTQLSSTSIRPFIFKFSNPNPPNTDSNLVALRKLESIIIKHALPDTDGSMAFALICNHLYVKDDTNIYTSSSKPGAYSRFLKYSIEREIKMTQSTNSIFRTETPIAFSLLTGKEALSKTQSENFYKFDFVNYGKEWKFRDHHTSKNNPFLFVPVKDIKYGSDTMTMLDLIFKKEPTETHSNFKTHFMQRSFYYELINSFEYSGNMENIELLNSIIYTHETLEKGVFNNVYIKSFNTKDTKYTIYGELKKSFNDRVLKTSVNPYKQIGSISDEKTPCKDCEKDNNNKGKRDKFSFTNIMVTIVIVFIFLLGTFVAIWSFYVKSNKDVLRKKSLQML